MEKIKTHKETFLSPETIGINRGMYGIHIWWGKKYFFTSQRNARRFIAITNQFYTQIMYEARMIYIDTWIKYQRSAPYFTHDTSAFSQADMKRTCRNAMRSVEDSLELMNERSHWDNGNWIVRNQFRVIIDSIHETISVLKELYESRNTAMELYELDSLGKRIHSLELTLTAFGDAEARELKKGELHNGKLPASLLKEKTKLIAIS